MAYAITILEIDDLKEWFNQIYPSLVQKYNFDWFHREDVYDWFIINALNNCVYFKFKAKVIQQSRHDVYRLAFEDPLNLGASCGHHFEIQLKLKLEKHRIEFYQSELIKAMCLDNIVILARGLNG